MNYEQIIGQAPATNPERIKAALLEVAQDIHKRLKALEPQTDAQEVDNGS